MVARKEVEVFLFTVIKKRLVFPEKANIFWCGTERHFHLSMMKPLDHCWDT